MGLILCIETGTDICSVALARDGEMIALRESDLGHDHARKVGVFTQELLQEHNIAPDELDAVAVGKGPGSYTGLRVGVSTAKGLCFGAGLPLLAVGTLNTLVAQAAVDDDEDFRYIIPMIDARRMEVYSAVFERTTDGAGFNQVTETVPVIVEPESYAGYMEQGRCLFIGDGAGKCADVLAHPNARFRQCNPKASSMLAPALDAYRKEQFMDVAYFEPFYLKEFVATVSKKKLF